MNTNIAFLHLFSDQNPYKLLEGESLHILVANALSLRSTSPWVLNL